MLCKASEHTAFFIITVKPLQSPLAMTTRPEAIRPIPAITHPPELPISALRDDIADAIENNQVVIVAGETGSGKTTQLPKLCLALGRGTQKVIGHTQPRRLAARTVAARIAAELDAQLGDLVGYQVRFHDQVSDASAIKLMTDGILLAEMQRDRLLRRYDTLIIDEAHERSLNIDFLLGYLKSILPQRPDLKVIVTSATIDVESFARHFNDAPIIEVSGRTYPIETHYLPPEAESQENTEFQIQSVVEDIQAGRYGPRGDVLVFLPGERDIRESARALRSIDNIDVLPLYARLTQSEQNRVFEGGSRRAGLRVVLATNVAETSLTVPGIRYVIDTGQARISRYSHRTKLQRLPVEAISRASADQRRGRCGRLGPGVCIRLYSEEDFNMRPEFTDPEIRRTNLAAVVLQMLTLRLGDISQFPFIDPPDPRMVRDGYKLLEELGAVTSAGKLTGVGRQLSRLPIDPRLGRMVLAAAGQGVLEEILIIASALAVQDPRERPAEKQAQADQQHARFKHKRSDFMAYLSLWLYYEEQRQALSQNQLRKLCKREFLAFMRMREWRDVHTQLRIACRSMKLPAPGKPGAEQGEPMDAGSNYDAIHKALLSGLLSNIAQWHEGREYLAARNRKVHLFPGSALARKAPKWVVAAEIVETARVYARQVASIDPHWALDINPHLLKKHYYQPRWHARRGQVVAYERVSLYGLTLSDKRSVHYGPIAPEQARELMIREGLIPGNMQRPPAFLRHNRALVASLEDLEARTRRRDILAEEQVQFEFYDALLPDEVCTASRLQSWLKRDAAAAKALHMSAELLSARDPGGAIGEQFPDALVIDDLRLRLSYEFEPGGAADGVSLTVPVALLNRVPHARLDWLVPGMLREKCIALVKALPKEKRKHLVPVPDHVDRALAQMIPGDTNLLHTLARQLSAQGRVVLSQADFTDLALDDYYRMNIRVVDADNRLLQQSRDFGALVAQFRDETQASITSTDVNSPARSNISRWDFDALPRQWRFRQAGVEIVSYPALVDKGSSAAIELCDYPDEALRQHRLGVLRLHRLGNAQSVKYLRKQLLRGNDFSLLLARAQIDRDTLVDDAIDAAVVEVMQLNGDLPFDKGAFTAQQSAGRANLVPYGTELETLLRAVLEVLGDIRQRLGDLAPGQRSVSGADIERQLAGLLSPAFLRDTPAVWLQQYPRYFKAVRQRLERLSGQQPKDEKYTALLAEVSAPLQALRESRPALLQQCEAAMSYRWLLEEFRVSLFAQNLGTRQAVSEKRLAQKWSEVTAWLAENP